MLKLNKDILPRQ